ncbi:MAG: hypothetical protein HY455_03160 [Parcubacteria group bacterium]|nr:hypothetical protein [Parcubacteria group bacterium]
MKGLQLRSLSGELHKVEPAYASKPAHAITGAKEKLGSWAQSLERDFERAFAFPDDCSRLPLEAFAGLSFDELCKIYYSSIFMMDTSVDKFFETSAQHEVVRKIKSSMWRWGCGTGTWNGVVDVYNGIRAFSLGLPDFEIRLDYTTYFNEFGRGKYSRVYLDGVFAFLVYYKRRHVMTISFSIMEKRQLLIQQVQLINRTGNRWLYRFPRNRLEFVIGLFKKYFSGFGLWVIDGKSLVKKTLADYRRGLRSAERVREPEECRGIKEKIAHLEGDKRRLASFYRNVGGYAFAFGASRKINGIMHRKIRSGSSVQCAV